MDLQHLHPDSEPSSNLRTLCPLGLANRARQEILYPLNPLLPLSKPLQPSVRSLGSFESPNRWRRGGFISSCWFILSIVRIRICYFLTTEALACQSKEGTRLKDQIEKFFAFAVLKICWNQKSLWRWSNLVLPYNSNNIFMLSILRE